MKILLPLHCCTCVFVTPERRRGWGRHMRSARWGRVCLPTVLSSDYRVDQDGISTSGWMCMLDCNRLSVLHFTEA